MRTLDIDLSWHLTSQDHLIFSSELDFADGFCGIRAAPWNKRSSGRDRMLSWLFLAAPDKTSSSLRGFWLAVAPRALHRNGVRLERRSACRCERPATGLSRPRCLFETGYQWRRASAVGAQRMSATTPSACHFHLWRSILWHVVGVKLCVHMPETLTANVHSSCL
jgi:hypothetical protein